MSNDKTAKTKFPVHDIIKGRWSARSYADKMITQDELMTMLEAASWTSSSMNEQPWLFEYAFRGTEAFQKIFDCLTQGNQAWASRCSVFVISLAKLHLDRNSEVNRHAMHDVGAANTALLIQGAALGIQGRMMGGFYIDKLSEAFHIDTDKFEVSCILGLGFPDSPEKLEEPYRTREMAERKRKSLDDISKEL